MSRIADPGFEQVVVGTGNYDYDPTGSPWTFSGTAGISGNGSSFTSGNPPAPEGLQVALLTGTGSFSQTFTAWSPGSYVLSLDAAQSATSPAPNQSFNVLIDGSVVVTFAPSGTSYQSYATAAFTLTVGAHTLAFQGLNSDAEPDTALLDQVALTQVSTSAIADPGFEQVQVGTGKFQYRPTGSPWTFGRGTGIAGNNSGFTAGNPPAPQGDQVAFLQDKGSISEVIAWAAGSYVLTFDAAQRGNNGTSMQNFSVLINGSVVNTFTPVGTSYQLYSTTPFTVPTAGPLTITFKGLDTVGGDNTALLDEVALTQITTPSIADPGFEQVRVGTGKFQYRPAGSQWTFGQGTGIAGNNSGFTAGNPPAPQGSQVAFLQELGSITQTVSGYAAGSYVLTFDAAQRGNNGTSEQNFNVLVNGTVVGTFTPSGTSYQSYSTAAFSLNTVGPITITFKGLDSVGGDNTALLDEVVLTQSNSASFADSGFEQVQVGAGEFQYRPTGSPWSFSDGAGLAANGSGFTSGNPNAPLGNQVAFLEEQGGTISQAVNFTAAGFYVIDVSAAQRGNFGTSDEQVEVLVDGTVVDTLTPASIDYTTYTTASFNVTAGSHTISFFGVDPSGVDYTALLDDADILAVG